MALSGREVGRARGRDQAPAQTQTQDQGGQASQAGQADDGGAPELETWEYEVYTPNPSTYESLHRYRKAAPVVIQQLSNTNPIKNTRTSILGRQSSHENGVTRQVYRVRIQHLAPPPSDNEDEFDDGEQVVLRTELYEVDVSRILDFVSHRELERFENSEFRAEADAQAIVHRTEAAERAQRQLAKNGPMSARGSKASDGLAPAQDRQGETTRGRERPIGSRRSGRESGPDIVPSSQISLRKETGKAAQAPEANSGDDMDVDDMDDKLVQSSPRQASLGRSIPETDEEMEDDDDIDPVVQRSPDLMRSSFVAHSALPITSPEQFNRTFPRPQETHLIEVSDDDSVSSGGRHLIFRRELSSPSDQDSNQKPTRAPIQIPIHMPITSRPMVLVPIFSDSESDTDISAPSHAVPANPFTRVPTNRARISPPTNSTSFANAPPNIDSTAAPNTGEEYAIEAIVKHISIDDVKYYLVKWEGYEEAEDWLAEHELSGARDMVRQYHAELARKRGKRRKRATTAAGRR